MPVVISRLESINVGVEQTLAVGERQVKTGIYKQPVADAVEIKPLGITGDVIKDGKYHGGVDQAIYIYSSEDYDYWAAQLGQPLAPGTFGENLTLDVLPTDVQVGDQLQFQEVVLQVTAPRIPCSILAARMGTSDFAKAFVQAERPGLYCRVLTPGILRPGETAEWQAFEKPSVSIVHFYRDAMRKLSAAEMERYLELPIDERNRKDFEKKLANRP